MQFGRIRTRPPGSPDGPVQLANSTSSTRAPDAAASTLNRCGSRDLVLIWSHPPASRSLAWPASHLGASQCACKPRSPRGLTRNGNRRSPSRQQARQRGCESPADPGRMPTVSRSASAYGPRAAGGMPTAHKPAAGIPPINSSRRQSTNRPSTYPDASARRCPCI